MYLKRTNQITGEKLKLQLWLLPNGKIGVEYEDGLKESIENVILEPNLLSIQNKYD